MKKIAVFFLIFLISPLCSYGFFHKKQKPVLILSAKDPSLIKSFDEVKNLKNIFKLNEKIYFTIYVPDGFNSEYIKYQILKQDDNAHDGGYTRIRNITKKINDKNIYYDYFVISQQGKYFIQVFDIQNLHQWLAIGAFRVVDE